jgi:hypothetical protein
MAAAYDEIADWYEQEFLARTAGTDPSALGVPCAACWATAMVSAWRSAVAPASMRPKAD